MVSDVVACYLSYTHSCYWQSQHCYLPVRSVVRVHLIYTLRHNVWLSRTCDTVSNLQDSPLTRLCHLWPQFLQWLSDPLPESLCGLVPVACGPWWVALLCCCCGRGCVGCTTLASAPFMAVDCSCVICKFPAYCKRASIDTSERLWPLSRALSCYQSKFVIVIWFLRLVEQRDEYMLVP